MEDKVIIYYIFHNPADIEDLKKKQEEHEKWREQNLEAEEEDEDEEEETAAETEDAEDPDDNDGYLSMLQNFLQSKLSLGTQNESVSKVRQN